MQLHGTNKNVVKAGASRRLFLYDAISLLTRSVIVQEQQQRVQGCQDPTGHLTGSGFSLVELPSE